ncbi:MAG TPA: enoyl-CoA hydratase-related protein [Candidatus Binatia bacterium]
MSVLLDQTERTAWITLDRPPLNVLDLSTIEELGATLERVQGDAAVDFLVLRGGGGRAFSAGVDVKDHTRERVPEMLEAVHGVIRRLFSLRQITVAQVRGACLGGGWELASSCDLVVASDDSVFATPEINVGCYPPVALARFPSQIGYHRAAELILTGTRLTAKEAMQFGLVNRVVGAHELCEAVESLLTDLKAKSAAVLGVALRGLRAMGMGGLEEALKTSERMYLDELLHTDDIEEGVQAFLAKRKPRWKHR